MKKIIKFIALVMIMFVGVFGLASCGKDYSKYVEDHGNTLINIGVCDGKAIIKVYDIKITGFKLISNIENNFEIDHNQKGKFLKTKMIKEKYKERTIYYTDFPTLYDFHNEYGLYKNIVIYFETENGEKKYKITSVNIHFEFDVDFKNFLIEQGVLK